MIVVLEAGSQRWRCQQRLVLVRTFSFRSQTELSQWYPHMAENRAVEASSPVTLAAAAAAAKSLQSCPTLCDSMDGSPPGSPVPGILQARTLECVAISFSNAWKWRVKVKSLSRVRLLATPWTAAYQAPPSMGFSRQEYRSGVPLPSPSSDSYKGTNPIHEGPTPMTSCAPVC